MKKRKRMIKGDTKLSEIIESLTIGILSLSNMEEYKDITNDFSIIINHKNGKAQVILADSMELMISGSDDNFLDEISNYLHKRTGAYLEIYPPVYVETEKGIEDDLIGGTGVKIITLNNRR